MLKIFFLLFFKNLLQTFQFFIIYSLDTLHFMFCILLILLKNFLFRQQNFILRFKFRQIRLQFVNFFFHLFIILLKTAIYIILIVNKNFKHVLIQHFLLKGRFVIHLTDIQVLVIHIENMFYFMH